MNWARRNFDPAGRTSRVDYWRFQIGSTLVLALAVGATVLAVNMSWTMFGALMFTFALAACLVGTALILVRRMHDRNRSAWWVVVFAAGPIGLLSVGETLLETRTSSNALLALPITIAGLGLCIWSWLEFGILRGTRGPNRYGPEPSAS
jgi:uncharacterized membrane protein YhaH (DUF805 family)